MLYVISEGPSATVPDFFTTRYITLPSVPSGDGGAGARMGANVAHRGDERTVAPTALPAAHAQPPPRRPTERTPFNPEGAPFPEGGRAGGWGKSLPTPLYYILCRKVTWLPLRRNM